MHSRKTHTLFRRFAALIVLASLTGAPGCASRRVSQTPTGRLEVQPGGFNAFSAEQEVQIGQQAAAETERELPVVEQSHEVSRYIRDLGQRLAAKAPEPKWPYTFKVINQKEINAFALPGGPIYINVGTIQAADEAELAGVMSHEIAHVVLRHGTSNASKQMAAQVPLAILGGMLGQGIGGQLARLGISFAAGSVFLKYSRDAEREADLVGAQIMYDAGFNPYSMAEFFETLEKQGGSRGPEFLASHPDPGNRAKNVSEVVQKFPPKQFDRQDSAEFQRVHAAAMDMKPLTAQQIAQRQREHEPKVEQISASDIRPSSDFRTLDHAAFRVAYPANWEVMGNQQSSVTIAPKGAASDHAVAYGVIISGIQSRSGQQLSLDDATKSLVEMIQQGNPGTRVAGGPREAGVNNMPARAVDLVGTSPVRTSSGGAVPERNLLVAIQRPDGIVLYMVFIAPEQHFNDLKPAFESMLRSLEMRPISG